MTYFFARAVLFWLTGAASIVVLLCRADHDGRSLLLLLFIPFVGYMEMDMLVRLLLLLSIATQRHGQHEHKAVQGVRLIFRCR